MVLTPMLETLTQDLIYTLVQEGGKGSSHNGLAVQGLSDNVITVSDRKLHGLLYSAVRETSTQGIEYHYVIFACVRAVE